MIRAIIKKKSYFKYLFYGTEHGHDIRLDVSMSAYMTPNCYEAAVEVKDAGLGELK